MTSSANRQHYCKQLFLFVFLPICLIENIISLQFFSLNVSGKLHQLGQRKGLDQGGFPPQRRKWLSRLSISLDLGKVAFYRRCHVLPSSALCSGHPEHQSCPECWPLWQEYCEQSDRHGCPLVQLVVRPSLVHHLPAAEGESQDRLQCKS